MSAGAKGLRGHILISHTHWDHIQGIPFFAPLFVPGNEWDIYGPKGLGQSLREGIFTTRSRSSTLVLCPTSFFPPHRP